MPKYVGDPEFVAIRKIERALKALPTPAVRKRTLEFVWERLKEQAMVPPEGRDSETGTAGGAQG